MSLAKLIEHFFFLFKLRSNLKQKILSINSVFDTREEILKIVIMQEKNLKRSREDDEHSNFNSNSNSNRGQFKLKDSKGSKSQQQSQQSRSSNNQQSSKS